ncbi:MAG TPA: NPCBM/NEW2 domain-containing protein [Candidatus Hydrogenedens sp.]|nr:NPCBM/NEW2 domain-containing protein [Candidatus Hydrogenedens sp.]HPP59085.1 NPCBM/NEW2 domain-containing protein [Candidatus Hydrogenedens sp.]
MIRTLLKIHRLIMICLFVISLPCFSDKMVYLSDMPERIISITQGWGETGWDVSAHASGQTPMELQIGEKKYQKGIGHHAVGEIVVDLGGKYKHFECEVGVQKQSGTNTGSVIFQIFVDDEKRWDSGVIRELDSPVPVKINLDNARELRLVVKDGNDGITCDCANWADAKLILTGNEEKTNKDNNLDIASFADVITCDPRRYEGARCSRVEEFPPEDVFLEKKITLQESGLYEVPDYEGLKCIGLRWYERRKLTDLEIEFADDNTPSKIRVEVWTGESPWQGKWQNVNGEIEMKGTQCALHIPWRDNLFIWKGTEKVRWVFETDKPLYIKKLNAYSNSYWEKTVIRLEKEKNDTNTQATLQIYNGKFLESLHPLNQIWKLPEPLTLNLLYSVPRSDKGDRTLLWIRLPDTKFCIAVEDIMSHPCVYVPSAGVFAVLQSSSLTINEYKKTIEGKQSVLDSVRSLPEQTFPNAMEKIHRPIQDNGPTMLSLACDNNKFIVEREGSIQFNDLFMKVRMGNTDKLKRTLYNAWLPIPVIEKNDNGITYFLRTFVAPYKEKKSLCISDFEIKNNDVKEKTPDFSLSFYSNKKEGIKAELEKKHNIIVVKKQEKIVGICKIENSIGEISGENILINHPISPGSFIKLFVIIPSDINIDIKVLEQIKEEELLGETVKYWENLCADSMKIDIPEPLLNNVIKASQVHCLIAGRSEEDLIAPWIASMSYGPLESEAHSIVYGMDLMGWHEFSKKSLEYFISKYNDAGYLTTGYTLMGTGWHLWTLAEHYRLTRDKEWLTKYADKLSRVCDWIMAQCEKTKKMEGNGDKVPEYGLMPPGVGADWNRFAYRFAIQGHFCAGLNGVGSILKDINHPLADKYIEGAKDLNASILRAFEWNKERTPVLPLSNGRWILPYPPNLYTFGTSGEMFPGEDAGRSWAYDVELGPHHLIPLGVLEPYSNDAENIVQHMEDYWFLHSDYWFAFSGEGDYPEEGNKQDPFNLGGFSKIQPYYTRIAETYAMRDEIKPFIRSYFNAIPSLLNTENLSFWEHFHNIGAWNKTHETGWFLVQTRKMFIREDKDVLWLAPFVPSYWLESGKQITITNADTYFGKVSYDLYSLDNNEIDGNVYLKKDVDFSKIILRIRHPSNKSIKKVLVNATEYANWDTQSSVVYLFPTPSKIEEKWVIKCMF